MLVEPEIPGNTGATARTCAAIGSRLHLVHPLGFRTDEAAVKRAGLDYWHLVDVQHHDNFESLERALAGLRVILTSAKGTTSYTELDMTGPCALVFGKETKGLSDSILSRYPDSVCRIPLRQGARSLNLSNAVAVVAFESMRQRGFVGLDRTR